MAPQTMIVRCKCPGSLGVARFEHDNTVAWFLEHHEAVNFFDRVVKFLCRETRCWNCGARFKFATLKGRYSSSHECNALCMASKGPSCECSCGGKNHGISYA